MPSKPGRPKYAWIFFPFWGACPRKKITLSQREAGHSWLSWRTTCFVQTTEQSRVSDGQLKEDYEGPSRPTPGCLPHQHPRQRGREDAEVRNIVHAAQGGEGRTTLHIWPETRGSVSGGGRPMPAVGERQGDGVGVGVGAWGRRQSRGLARRS